jgi:hypothetical protein
MRIDTSMSLDDWVGWDCGPLTWNVLLRDEDSREGVRHAEDVPPERKRDVVTDAAAVT